MTWRVDAEAKYGGTDMFASRTELHVAPCTRMFVIAPTFT